MSVVWLTSPVTHFSTPPDGPLPRDPEGGPEEPEETMKLEEMGKRPDDSIYRNLGQVSGRYWLVEAAAEGPRRCATGLQSGVLIFRHFYGHSPF